MSRAVGIEQVSQLVRCALLIADWVVPGVRSICEMCRVEKVVVTINLGLTVDRHHASLEHHIPPNKRLAVSSGEWESCSLRERLCARHRRADRRCAPRAAPMVAVSRTSTLRFPGCCVRRSQESPSAVTHGPRDRAAGVTAAKLLAFTPFPGLSPPAGIAAQHDRTIAPAAPTEPRQSPALRLL